jgi:DNA-directed RNA polymerase subunit RPC12/RpoP
MVGKCPEFGSLYFNCQECQSTFLLMSKKTMEILRQTRIKAAEAS